MRRAARAAPIASVSEPPNHLALAHVEEWSASSRSPRCISPKPNPCTRTLNLTLSQPTGMLRGQSSTTLHSAHAAALSRHASATPLRRLYSPRLSRLRRHDRFCRCLLRLLWPWCRLCDFPATPLTHVRAASSLRLLRNTPAMPLRWPYARDCNPYPTDYRLTALRRLWAGSSADDINRLQRLARLQGVL